MSGIFISYRRSDAQGWAGRLGADIAAAFGDAARFLDLESIPPGREFRRDIDAALAGCDATLVLVGPGWVGAGGAAGRRRLFEPDDVVAAEVAAALARPTPTIPVLLGGAPMPRADELPPALAPLAGRNAFELSDSRWAYDTGRLFDALEAETPLRRRAAPAAASAAAGVRVGVGAELDSVEAGNVTGVRGHPPGAAAAGPVDVLSGAKIRRTKLGDITGVDLGGPPPPDRS